MNKSNQGKIGSPSHNDNRLTKSQLDFLNSNGNRTLVDNSFAHYHFVGAPFKGLYTSNVKYEEFYTKVTRKLKTRMVRPIRAIETQDQWMEIFWPLPEKAQTAPEPICTPQTPEQMEKRRKLADKYANMILRKGCYHCNSKSWGHWGLDFETNWLSCRCRSCYQDFYFKFGHGMNSYGGMMGVVQREERARLEKLAYADPYLAWLLQCQGIEPNPGPGENTKRDSKRHEPEQRTRMEKLANKQPSIYAKLRKQAEKLVVEKRRTAQFKQQLEALSPKVQSWGIPVTLRLESFEAMFQKFLRTLPPEVSEALKWTDIAAAIYVLFFDTSPPAKWLACRALFNLLGIQSMTVAAFSALLFHVLKIIRFIDTGPRLNASDMTTSLSVIMTLALTILFRQKPSQGRVDTALHALKDLPPTARGMELVMNVFEKAVDYVKSLFLGPDDVTRNIQLIKDRVKFYLSDEGQKAISLNLGSFTELAELQQRAIEVESELTTSLERASFSNRKSSQCFIQKSISHAHSWACE
jgi:hypothetical protein